MSEVKFIPQEALQDFFETLAAGRKVYGTQRIEEHGRLGSLPSADRVELLEKRPVESVKSLFFRLRQDLGGYFDVETADGGGAGEPSAEPAVVIGVAPCDLSSLEVLDAVFLDGDFIDPYYRAFREKTLLVSVDCAEPGERCFCTFVDGKPWAEGGFDVNLSPVPGGYLAEAGSDEGTRLLGGLDEKLRDATDEELAERERNREAALEEVRSRAAAAGLSGAEGLQQAVRESRDSGLWNRLAETCVECAACNFVCPTCHCFVLLDVQEEQGFRRFRNWDACLYRSFAKEAGGANPRERRRERLHGRMEKKFAFLKENVGRWGCVGCGRCIEACAGGIDIRETLSELINAQPVQTGQSEALESND